ncbi:hypothetical protein ig2599ANME_0490 [groundwater metagenome]
MTALEKVYKIDYADVMIWLGIILMLLWAIGKSLGLI